MLHIEPSGFSYGQCVGFIKMEKFCMIRKPEIYVEYQFSSLLAIYPPPPLPPPHPTYQ